LWDGQAPQHEKDSPAMRFTKATAVVLGKKGGSVRSEAKRRAAQANSRRPRPTRRKDTKLTDEVIREMRRDRDRVIHGAIRTAAC
jgi:hypothetical protein